MTPIRFSWFCARLAAVVLVLLAPLPGTVVDAGAQELWTPLAPPGRLELSAVPTFVSWDSRLGEPHELLSSDLTDLSSRSIFPGVAHLEEAVRALTGNEGYRAYVGVSRARITRSRTELPIRAAFGVFDWLTVGVTVPLVKGRTELTYSFLGDSTSLGINPLVTDRSSVLGYVAQVEAVYLAAAQQAAAACEDAPASPDCVSALEAQILAFGYLGSLEELYNASSFFPTAESVAGEDLRAWASNTNDALQEAGLGNVTGLLPLPEAPVLSEDDVETVVTASSGGIQMNGLGAAPFVWTLGDVEVGAWARVLHGERRDSAEAPVSLRYDVAAGALVRLGTGTVDDPDVVHGGGSGDGQMDIEGQLHGELATGRLGLSGSIRYGVQMPTTLPRRIAPLGMALPSVSSLAEVEWTPGNYLEIDVAPRYRLTPELGLATWYALRTKGADTYERISPLTPGPGLDERFPGPLYTDAALLEEGSDETVHRAGLALTFSTLEAWREGDTGTPFQAYISLGTVVGGRGDRTPDAFTAQAGIRLYRRIVGN